ncbi:hypothetical protein [Psychrobacillus psychrotolerans]|uniref:hypothetical protein n=1 Tax=Psychrobacillus psychrotolerans TaxID=126156 RepID=UPI003C7275DC
MKNITNQLNYRNKQKEMERMKMAKKGTQKETKVEGIEYIFQHPGLLESIRMRDRSKNEGGSMNEENLYKELMEHVIFLKEGGKVTFDHFEEHEGFKDVIKEAIAFTFR